jgi:hypothetical protein
MRCNGASGFIPSYKVIMDAEEKAKSVTSNLSLLSVLVGRSKLLIVMLQLFLERSKIDFI